MEPPEHSARSIYGETLGRASQGLREVSLMGEFRSRPGKAGPGSGNIPLWESPGGPTEHLPFHLREQRLPTSLPAMPSIPPWHHWVLLRGIKPSTTRTRAPAPAMLAGIAAGTQMPPEVCILTTKKSPKMGLGVKFAIYLPPAQLHTSLLVVSSPLEDICQGYFINSFLFIAQLLQL